MIQAIKYRKRYINSIEVAQKYFGILSVLNNFKLTPMEIKILAFTAIRGNIAGTAKANFAEMFDTTVASVTKSISALYGNHFLVKSPRKIQVHPQLLTEFAVDNLIIQVNMSHDDQGQAN